MTCVPFRSAALGSPFPRLGTRITVRGSRRASSPLPGSAARRAPAGGPRPGRRLIFQDGRLQGPLDFTSFGAITPWVPLFLFVFLFGLSMDYHVFILSRIRELRSRGTSTTDAVTGGIASSAGVVTSAALIMVAVFSVFASMHLFELKMLGIGLPAAVLIDATIVRGVLVPAAMAVLGDRCWYLPRWLSWIPGRPATTAPDPRHADLGSGKVPV
jgi:putative drug exporter of the RND superfamily